MKYISKNGEVERALVKDAITDIIDNIVKNNSAKITLKRLIPQIIHVTIEVSKK